MKMWHAAKSLCRKKCTLRDLIRKVEWKNINVLSKHLLIAKKGKNRPKEKQKRGNNIKSRNE